MYFLNCFSDPTFFSYILLVIKVDNPKSSHLEGVGCVNLVLKKKKKRESDMYEERCPLNSRDSDTVSCGRLCKLLFVVSL